MTGDLLDRIHVEATDHARGSTERGLLGVRLADRSAVRRRQGVPEPLAADRPRSGQAKESCRRRSRSTGGASITRISRLASMPGALLVEGHFAFAEPHAWFDGAPILRSKISLVAQDQIRRLRRELAQKAPGTPRLTHDLSRPRVQAAVDRRAAG